MTTTHSPETQLQSLIEAYPGIDLDAFLDPRVVEAGEEAVEIVRAVRLLLEARNDADYPVIYAAVERDLPEFVERFLALVAPGHRR